MRRGAGKVFAQLSREKAGGACGGQRPMTCPYRRAAQERKLGETAKRFSRTAECLRCQFAPMAARSARAHRKDSARARRRLLEKPLRHAKGMTLSPAGSGDAAQWAASITDRRGSGDQALNGAHWAPAPPKGEARLGSPFGGAVAVRRLRRAARHASTQPMRGAVGNLPSPSSLTRVHSRLPARVMQPSGLRPSPTEAAAETLARRQP